MIQSRSSKQKSTNNPIQSRSKIALISIFFFLFTISARLFYWQIIAGESLSKEAEDQYSRSVTLTGNRGSIYTSDGYTVVSNEQVYTLFVQPHILEDSVDEISKKIFPILLEELDDYKQATLSSEQQEIAQNYETQIKNKLSKNAKWVSIKANIPESTKKSSNLFLFKK